MHPVLPEDRFEPCKIYIDALHKCHDSSIFARFSGKCNGEYQEMVKCLKKVRKQNMEENAAKARASKGTA